MACWTGMSRSNYFRLNDEVAFRRWAQELGLVVITNDNAGFGFYSNSDDGGLPASRVGEDDHDEDIDLETELATHLAEGEVAIIMSIGHEKARYLSAYAAAVSSTEERVTLDISDIYEKAAQFFGADLSAISRAEY